MTSKQFTQFIEDNDQSFRRLFREIDYAGSDRFNPLLYSKAILMKLRTAFTIFGKQIAEQRSTASDLQYQHEQWLGQVWAQQENAARSTRRKT